MNKKILVATGGGDCPGLNAVLRALAKSASTEGGWEVWGSIEAFEGVFQDPPNLMPLTTGRTAGIHVLGGTIIKTTNRNNPLKYPVQQDDGSWTTIDRTAELARRIRDLGFDAVVNIGGDGSQLISKALSDHGLPVIGVPKTIDNDLSATDLTFGFSTAVQIATDSFDKLVTTAESHHRVMIMEVMGRHAGWIALHTAIAGGAEICLIPEIPYDAAKIVARIHRRFTQGSGFANIVVAEGALPRGGEVVGQQASDMGDMHLKLGGIGNYLRMQLEDAGCEAQVRTTILGHVQRGGTPVAFDRILATTMGVKAFELIREGAFGQMVSYRGNRLEAVSLEEATRENKQVSPEHYLVQTARKLGISFGD